MSIDYSKWDKIEVSDDEESHKLNVVKLNPNQQVILSKDGYKVKDSTDKKVIELEDVSKEWYKRVLHGIVTVDSHFYSQDRYSVNFYILLNFDYKKLTLKFNEISISLCDNEKEIMCKEFYSKIKKDESFWNWEIVNLEIDWKSLKEYSKKVNSEKLKPKLYFENRVKAKFIEVNVQKLVEISDCFIWWPKLFKDDVEEIRIVDNSEFIKVWDEAHEKFREKVSNHEKIPI
nr:SprA protein [Theileria orientalis]